MEYVKNNWKYISLILLCTLGIAFLLATVVPVFYQNSVASAETFVQQAKDDCATTVSNGEVSIVELVQVDQNTKDFIINAFKAANESNTKLAGQAQAAYGQFVNGNTQPFLLLMSTMSGTNITATAENVQREIVAQRAAMVVCAKALNNSQKLLKDKLGYNSANQTVQFPQNHMHLVLGEVADGSLRDNDHDGVLTVLDYRPPVDVKTMNSFGTGEATDVPQLYKQP